MYIVQLKILYCFKVKNKASGIDCQQSYTAKDHQVKRNSKTLAWSCLFVMSLCQEIFCVFVLFACNIPLSGYFPDGAALRITQ